MAVFHMLSPRPPLPGLDWLGLSAPDISTTVCLRTFNSFVLNYMLSKTHPQMSQ